MKIQTSINDKNINQIEIEPTEKIELSFDADGVNALPGSTKKITLRIGTLLLGDKMALTIFTDSPLYENKTAIPVVTSDHPNFFSFFIIDEPNGADTLEFKTYKIKLEKIK